MLEGSCIASKESPASCEQESQRTFSTSYVVELSGKRRIEDEDVESRKAARLLDANDSQQEMEGLLEVLPSLQIDQSDKENQAEALTDISVMQSDHPGQSGLSALQTDQTERLLVRLVLQSDHPVQQQVAGFSDLSVVQTDQPYTQQQENGPQEFSIMQANQADCQDQEDEKADSSSLINPLGRELSISCLLHCSRSDYGNIASLNKSFLSLIRSGLLYKLRRSMGFVEDWVYFSCNLLEWEAFDPIRCRWMHLPRMNANECFMCSDKESLAVGTQLLVFGKEIESHVIYKYSILSNMWTSGMKMNAPRCLFGSASLGEIAILAGGCDPAGKILSSAELYNSETGTWSTIPSMHKARKMCSGVFMDGKFYVIGGRGIGNTNMLTCAEVYDLATKTWRVIPDMLPARNGGTRGNETPAAAEAPPLVAVVNNELYAADYAQKEVRKYDKEKNAWNTLGGLPEDAVSMNGWGLAFRACGDRLIVIGGPRALGGGMIELNSWVPSEGPPKWNLLAKKQSGSFVYNCAVMGC
ncbi:F-box/kelch-repeat protein At1g74510-like [Mercurialis annua]|uniref:F-box/kelch-repeat protein At1g74510-like n=1 Tax=Mercurialis annua TaxID=3986 RepID=UPI002160004C|nr:F-box/kelch-repeat protein At1g74510-like [Mercurialis annua]